MNVNKKTYTIRGMSCASCAATIERAVQQLPEVKYAFVNLSNEQLTIEPIGCDLDSQLIISTVTKAGYQANEVIDQTLQAKVDQYDERNLLKNKLLNKFIIATVVTIPLLYLSMGSMIGLPTPAFLDADHAPVTFSLVQLLLTIPTMIVGFDFYRRGFKNLIQLHPNMDSLIAIGTMSAFLYGLYAIYHILNGHYHYTHELYFESVAVIITLILLGKYLEANAKGKTSQAIQRLLSLTPTVATVIRNGETVEIQTEQIEIGDVIRVKPGESMPVDGIVVRGETTVDESMITGESIPVAKKQGDEIISATINKHGSIDYSATKIGNDTTVAKIIQLVEEAQNSKAPIATLADKISLYFVPTVLLLATVASFLWYVFAQQSVSFALAIFIAVLIIACPCALGLATPTAIMVGTGKGAEHGILIKSGEALETTHTIQTIVLDKTGTITKGVPAVTDYSIQAPFQQETVLQLVASVEQASEHPLADAIVTAAREQNIPLLETTEFQALVGQGLQATVNGQQLFIGNESLMQHKQIPLDEQIFAQQTTWAKEGKTVIFIAINHQFAGLMAIADPVKESSAQAVNRLQTLGIEVIMLTGDQKDTAESIAKKVGITRVYSQVLPEDKAQIVADIQAEGKAVAMVGDGINDAPALAQATVGIAIGSGTDVAIESADIVLMHSDLMDVVKTIQLSRATIKTIKENLFWAFAYNILGIPIAMGLLHLFGGPLLNPMIAGVAMSFSSVSVLLNALRLKYLKLDESTQKG